MTPVSLDDIKLPPYPAGADPEKDPMWQLGGGYVRLLGGQHRKQRVELAKKVMKDKTGNEVLDKVLYRAVWPDKPEADRKARFSKWKNGAAGQVSIEKLEPLGEMLDVSVGWLDQGTIASLTRPDCPHALVPYAATFARTIRLMAITQIWFGALYGSGEPTAGAGGVEKTTSDGRPDAHRPIGHWMQYIDEIPFVLDEDRRWFQHCYPLVAEACPEQRLMYIKHLDEIRSAILLCDKEAQGYVPSRGRLIFGATAAQMPDLMHRFSHARQASHGSKPTSIVVPPEYTDTKTAKPPSPARKPARRR